MPEKGSKARWAVGILGDEIACSLPPQLYKEVRTVAGAQYDAKQRWWHWPKSHATARTLHQILPYWITRTEGFTKLIEEALAAEADLIQIRTGEVEPVPVEPTEQPHWKHQQRAFWFAQGQQAVMLAMGMGTGKTRVIVDLCQYRQHKRILIVCKKTILSDGVWGRNFKQFYRAGPVHVVELHKGTIADRKGDAALEMLLFSKTPDVALVFVINYDAVTFDPMRKWLLEQQWDLVVCDESHHIKAAGGKRSRTMQAIGKRAKYRACLTGTPLANSPLDAYAQYRFLDTSVFGSSYTMFRSRYAVMGGWENREVKGYQNLADFQQRFYSIAYEVGKDVLDLPAQHHVTRYASLGHKAQKHYDELSDDFVTWLNGTDAEPVTAQNALVRLLRLQQVTGGSLDGVVIDESKAELLQEVLEEIDPSEPVVIFARFKADLAVIQERVKLAGRNHYELSGSSDGLNQWKADTTGAVLAVQVQAGSEGIELTKAMYCIYYSLGFSLSQYDQSLSRVHRPGQTRATVYTHLVMKGTVDEQVYKALSEKRQVVEAIIKGEV